MGTAEGKELERQIKEIAAKGIRVVGPNCFGIYCPASGLTLLPGPDLSRESGPVAFLAQSGGMSIDFAHAGKWLGIRFSKMVSFGNGADLREAELLRYLADDPETQVISMYIEGIKDGDNFFSEIKAAASKKPVIVYKGGLSSCRRQNRCQPHRLDGRKRRYLEIHSETGQRHSGQRHGRNGAGQPGLFHAAAKVI